MANGNDGVSRRTLLGASLLGAAAAGAAPGAAGLAAGKGEGLQLAVDGTYPCVALTKPAVRLAAVQSRVRAVDIGNLERTKRENLDHLLELIDAAQGWGGPKDILFFHEFPITGYSDRWDRKQALRAAIEIPGPETEAVAKKAREYGCYIVFGSYARDNDWPDHLLSITSVIDPKGVLVGRDWKARNIKGLFQGFELFTTTIYDVLDRYIEMYGSDAVIPVIQTPLGNIATSSVQREPELFRCMAMKGAEIILRTATGGFTAEDIKMTSVYNNVYTAVCNNAVSPNNPGFVEDAGSSGGTTIFGPQGEVLAAANSEHETIVTTTVPIEDFRNRRRLPQVHMDLYRPVLDAYRNRYPPNLFLSYLPTDGRDSARYLKDKAVWVK